MVLNMSVETKFEGSVLGGQVLLWTAEDLVIGQLKFMSDSRIWFAMENNKEQRELAGPLKCRGLASEQWSQDVSSLQPSELLLAAFFLDSFCPQSHKMTTDPEQLLCHIVSIEESTCPHSFPSFLQRQKKQRSAYYWLSCPHEYLQTNCYNQGV